MLINLKYCSHSTIQDFFYFVTADLRVDVETGMAEIKKQSQFHFCSASSSSKHKTSIHTTQYANPVQFPVSISFKAQSYIIALLNGLLASMFVLLQLPQSIL